MRKLLQKWFGEPDQVEVTSQDAPGTIETPDPASLPALQRLGILEADLAQLRLEWAETLDKLSNWASRQAARDRKVFGKQLALDPEAQEVRTSAGEVAAATEGAPPTKAELRSRLAALQRNRSA
jgi:hypothetical protein